MRLKQPRKERRRALAPLWLPFSRWLGRELNAPERKIAYALENQRRQQGGIRAVVTDKGPFDSRPILKKYVAWLLETKYRISDMALIAPTRRQAYLESIGMPRRPFLAYPSRPYGLRGRNYDIALYLDAGGRTFQGPLMLTITGTVSDFGVIIVHTRKSDIRPTPRYAESSFYDPPPPAPAPPPDEADVEIFILPIAKESSEVIKPSFLYLPLLLFDYAVAVTAPEGKTAKRTLTFCRGPPESASLYN